MGVNACDILHNHENFLTIKEAKGKEKNVMVQANVQVYLFFLFSLQDSCHFKQIITLYLINIYRKYMKTAAQKIKDQGKKSFYIRMQTDK